MPSPWWKRREKNIVWSKPLPSGLHATMMKNGSIEIEALDDEEGFPLVLRAEDIMIIVEQLHNV